MNLLRPIAAFFTLMMVGLAIAQPVGTAFTFQGQLSDQGALADGEYDFAFRLFDQETDGSQLANEILLESVTVADGIFTVQIDFGLVPFSSSDQARWLEIDVQARNGAGPRTTLSPRQIISPVPYSLHAEYVPEGSIGLTEVDTGNIQLRVTGDCAVGSAIRSIGEDGSVSCEPDDDGSAALSSHANDENAHHTNTWISPSPATLYTPDNYVGINTSVPEATLHINDADGTRPAMLIEGASVSEGDIAWPLGQNLQMGTWDEANTEFLRHFSLTSDGLTYVNDRLYFGSTTGEKISLFGDRFGLSSMYGLGVSDDARLFFKANQGYEFYVSDSDITVSNPSMYLANSGMGINTTNLSGYTLAVNGDIRAKEIVVETGWADFVFEPDYQLPTLEEVDAFINANGHLPDIPSAAEVARDGVRVGEMESRLLQKIEELTLYSIDMSRRLEMLEQQSAAGTSQ